MIYMLGDFSNHKLWAFYAIMFSFVVTGILLNTATQFLPRDGGRAYAVDGKLSAGKPRGAGFIFIIVFAVSTALFLPINAEIAVYLILTLAAMLTGFLDDCSRSPWGEWKKGLLDLIISLMVALAIYKFGSSTIFINIIGQAITIPPVIFVILATILAWASINVTNCSDGVDGLSGTLSIITLMSIYSIGNLKGVNSSFQFIIITMVASVLAYLWYNATPSKMIMGDAGSRALGLFIAIAILKTGNPLLYIPVAFMLIIDGGLGLIKVSLIRLTKVNIMKNLRTPIHDHVRKNKGWSNTQAVFKFAIIQIVISFVTIWFLN